MTDGINDAQQTTGGGVWEGEFEGGRGWGGGGDARRANNPEGTVDARRSPFPTDPGEQRTGFEGPGKPGHGFTDLPREAREAIREYVQERETRGRISADEFTRNTEIGRELLALGVKEPGHAAKYARRYAAYLDGDEHRHRDWEPDRSETQREVVRKEFDDRGERSERRFERNQNPFRFEASRLRNPVWGDQTAGDYKGLGRVTDGALQIVDGRVVNGAGQVVVGAGEIVGAVLNEAGQLVGVQVAGGEVVMLDGRVLSAPPSVEGQPLLYQSDGRLVPTSNLNAGDAVVNTGAGQQATAAANAQTSARPDGGTTSYTAAATAEVAGTPATPTAAAGAPPTPAASEGGSAAAGATTNAPTGASTVTAPVTAAGGAQVTTPTTGGSRATAAAAAAATGQPGGVPGAQFAHNPGGPPPWAPAHGYRGHGGHPVHGEGHGNLGKGLIAGLQQVLSELLGTWVSRGQTQRFISQLSPAALSAFLANPTQPQPEVMSTLMSVVMRDHGKPNHVGRDALLALFDNLMSRNPSAREVHNFFKSLAPEQIEQLIAHRAETIGNLPGVPQEVRVAANAQRIEAELTVMQGSRDPAAQRRAQTLEQLLAQNAQILHFDNAPDGRLAAGRISQVFGNLAEAKYVSLVIPGLNNTMDNFSARAERGQLLHQLAQPMVREGTAMVVWLERLGQEVLRQYRSMLTAWQAREQTTRAPMTFQQALAQAARQLAQESVPGMMLRGDARLTFVGHSFGSLIAKEALNHGAKPDACVFLGMPENRLKKIAAQAGCGDVDLYSMVADGDTVDEAVAADEAPEAEAAEAADAAALDEEIERLDPGKDLVPPIEAVLDPHDNYGLEGSASLAQIVGVTLGWRPKLLPPEPSVITLYRSADGTYEDQAEPVGWFGPKGEEW